MRRREWTWLAMAVGACVGVALLAGRGGATAMWIAIPLAAWLLAATRARTSVVAAGTQIALIVGLAIAASGHAGVGPLSFWDAALAYDLMALAACMAAWYATERTHMDGRYPRPTALRRRLARIERIAAPVAVIVVGCVAGVVALPVRPPTPPPGILYPLPDALQPTEVGFYCVLGRSVTCVWSTSVKANDETRDRLVSILEADLNRTKGWRLARSRCRTWGWVIKERACVMIEPRAVLLVVAGTPAQFYSNDRVTIVVTYG
jgi:hypothetical protein